MPNLKRNTRRNQEMTDRQALETLKSWLLVAYQNTDGTDESSAELYESLQTVFNLINRQQEEIDKMEIENQSLRSAANSYKIHYSKTRAEALREFVEELKKRASTIFIATYPDGNERITSYQFSPETIDSLVKEMEGKKDETT